ncbi:MAG: phosphopyruvate hydratase [Clostridia bacterium]|nr:phosphopyruvate hydratase [Clostridia bacterium]
MNIAHIAHCRGREILDSRGNPTVEATVILDDGSVGIASAPSGASTGIYEAHEKRDGDSKRYFGRGTKETAKLIEQEIGAAVIGLRADDQGKLDDRLCRLDGTENKSRLGANALLSVSLAAARAAAAHYKLPLYRYLGGICAARMPVPMMNILNGGAHASNNVEVQEFMIAPIGAKNLTEAVRMCSEVYATLGKRLRAAHHATTVGDEGGFAPNLSSDEEAMGLICDAIRDAGYSTDEIRLALDAAASEWAQSGEGATEDAPPACYIRPKTGERFETDDLIRYWERMFDRYPLISLEDGLDQRDFDGWVKLTRALGGRGMLVGDDLFVTNAKRLRMGIERGAGNAILIKPNQIGTLSETVAVVGMARAAGYDYILSHRSGETEDTTLADLSVALGAAWIKTGAPCRGERTAKYNRLMSIEAACGENARYGKR